MNNCVPSKSESGIEDVRPIQAILESTDQILEEILKTLQIIRSTLGQIEEPVLEERVHEIENSCIRNHCLINETFAVNALKLTTSIQKTLA